MILMVLPQLAKKYKASTPTKFPFMYLPQLQGVDNLAIQPLRTILHAKLGADAGYIPSRPITRCYRSERPGSSS